jgi:hypothetical protein
MHGSLGTENYETRKAFWAELRLSSPIRLEVCRHARSHTRWNQCANASS